MSNICEIKVPDVGNVHDIDVVEVSIQAGDVIVLDQTIATLETDKASMDLPATATGTVQQVHIKVGDKVNEGTLIATVLVDDVTAVPATPVFETIAVAEVKPVEAVSVTSTPIEINVPIAKSVDVSVESQVQSYSAHASPSVRLFARELGVDLSKVTQGSGRKGRILKDDVKNYVKKILVEGVKIGSGAGIPSIPVPDFSVFGAIDIQPLSKINRLTGQHMTSVWLNLPMVTYHDEVDITDMEAFRVALNNEKNKEGVKYTGLLFIVKALAAAMGQFPRFNSSLSSDGESLIFKKYLNIGIAVNTPNGLVVPVLRDVTSKTVKQLAIELAEKSEKARSGKLLPSDMQGGCISISSLGGIGGTAFTPIVNAPEVAILGVTKSKIQPVWNGETFEPRLMLPLDLTYDHRVIDGAEGAQFMEAVKYYLGDIRRLLV
ncbi:MAG: dihydrolipoyllysine-residue acetyltransferase [Pseudomonadota bacterium]